jgi:hypothetical protein
VILWALYGIVLKREQVDEIVFHEVINAALAGFITIVIAIIIRLFRSKKFETQPAIN